MFSINPIRKKVIEYHADATEEQEAIDFTVTFDFPCTEDIDMQRMLDKLKVKSLNDLTKENPKSTNYMLTLFREALVDCTDILNENDLDGDGKPRPCIITDADGKINVDVQKGIFEEIKNLDGMLNKIVLAYTGNKSKNSNPGVTQ